LSLDSPWLYTEPASKLHACTTSGVSAAKPYLEDERQDTAIKRLKERREEEEGGGGVPSMGTIDHIGSDIFNSFRPEICLQYELIVHGVLVNPFGCKSSPPHTGDG
jgi:hypothetical protein